MLPGICRRHGDGDAADADTDQGTDLEQLEPYGAAGGSGELGVRQADGGKAGLVRGHAYPLGRKLGMLPDVGVPSSAAGHAVLPATSAGLAAS